MDDNVLCSTDGGDFCQVDGGELATFCSRTPPLQPSFSEASCAAECFTSASLFFTSLMFCPLCLLTLHVENVVTLFGDFVHVFYADWLIVVTHFLVNTSIE